MAAIDTHIKFKGVEGESQHQDHKGEIELLSWSHGIFNETHGAGGGMGRGKAQPGKFHFSHFYDKASPTLMKKCALGEHFDEVIITSRKSGQGQKDFLKITLKEVFISSINPAGSQGGDIVEGVDMTYSEVAYEYKAQDGKGATGGPVQFSWNTKSTKIT